MAVPITSANDLRGVPQEIKILLTMCLEKKGWRVVRTTAAHFQVFPPRPSGAPRGRSSIVTVPGKATAAKRSINNTRADLRRAGLEI